MGYHYPIKCVWCSHLLRNDEVLFNFEKTNEGKARELRIARTDAFTDEDTPEQPAAAPAFGGSADMGMDVLLGKIAGSDGAAAQGEKPQEPQAPLHSKRKKMMTLPEAQNYFKYRDQKCTPQYIKVKVTADHINDAGVERQDLLTAIDFEDDDGVETRASRRYCPHCRGELPVECGKMPTFIVHVLGASNTGKTVYLCVLNLIFREEIDAQPKPDAPYGTCTFSPVVTGQMKNEIRDLANAMKRDNLLPDTTRDRLVEPLMAKVTYSYSAPVRGEWHHWKKECLLVLADMRGEDLTNGENLMNMQQEYANADGFLVLISPFGFRNYANRAVGVQGGDVARDTLAGLHATIRGTIDAYILPAMPGGVVRVPCVAVMTKCDRLAELGVPASNPVMEHLLPGQDEDESKYPFHKPYVDSQDSGAAKVMDAGDDGTMLHFLQEHFPMLDCSAVSALGPNVSMSEGDGTAGGLRYAGIVRPLRVLDPIYLLLIRSGFLPGFDRIVPTYDPDSASGHWQRAKIEKDNAVKKENNRSVMKEWIDRQPVAEDD